MFFRDLTLGNTYTFKNVAQLFYPDAKLNTLNKRALAVGAWINRTNTASAGWKADIALKCREFLISINNGDVVRPAAPSDVEAIERNHDVDIARTMESVRSGGEQRADRIRARDRRIQDAGHGAAPPAYLDLGGNLIRHSDYLREQREDGVRFSPKSVIRSMC